MCILAETGTVACESPVMWLAEFIGPIPAPTLSMQTIIRALKMLGEQNRTVYLSPIEYNILLLQTIRKDKKTTP